MPGQKPGIGFFGDDLARCANLEREPWTHTFVTGGELLCPC